MGDFLYCAAKSAAMRVLIFSQATLIAIPFKSLPELAAVADVLGTLAVSVAVILMVLIDTPNSSAATWAVF